MDPSAAFEHSIVGGNMSLLRILRNEFTDDNWEQFRSAHMQAYTMFAQFHFIVDIRDINPSHCSHLWNFIQHLTSTEIKHQTERQVASIYIVSNHNGIITKTIENMLNWYGNIIDVRFVPSVDDAISDRVHNYPLKATDTREIARAAPAAQSEV